MLILFSTGLFTVCVQMVLVVVVEVFITDGVVEVLRLQLRGIVRV